MNNLVTNFKLRAFMIYYNLFYLVVIGYDLLIKNFVNNTWYTPIIIFVLVVIASLAFRPLNKSYNLFKIISKNKIISSVIFIYIICTNSLLISYFVLFLKNYFYSDISFIIFFILIAAICIYVSTQSFHSIINTGIILIVIISLLYLIPLITTNTRNFELLLPFNLNFDKLYIPILLITIPLDGILFAFYSQQIKKGFTNKDLIISSAVLLLLFLYIIIDDTTLISPYFYQDIDLYVFYHWEIYQGNKFISNYNLAVLIIMFASTIFKAGISLQIARIITKSNKVKLLNFFIGLGLLVIGVLLYRSFTNYYQLSFMFLILSAILMTIIYIYLCIIIRRKEIISYD